MRLLGHLWLGSFFFVRWNPQLTLGCLYPFLASLYLHLKADVNE